MNPCRSPPLRLYYFGPLDESCGIKAVNARRLGDPDDDVLSLDLAKDQLKRKANGPYISLFASMAAVRRFLSAHNLDEKSSNNCVMCEIDTSELDSPKFYKVSEIASGMGAVASKPVPDFLASGVIIQEAIKKLP